MMISWATMGEFEYRIFWFRPGKEVARFSLNDGDKSYQLVGGVKAYQDNDA